MAGQTSLERKNGKEKGKASLLLFFLVFSLFIPPKLHLLRRLASYPSGQHTCRESWKLYATEVQDEFRRVHLVQKVVLLITSSHLKYFI